MRIAAAQLNPTVGDIAGNNALICAVYEQAKTADLVVCPELALIGYPPEDLVLSPAFRAQAMAAAKELAGITKNGPALIFGSLWEEAGKVYNAAFFCEGGNIAHIQAKTHLPNYGIFDEKRLFAAATEQKIIRYRNTNIALLICEDVWHDDLPQLYATQSAELLIVINASPFEAGKLAERYRIATQAARTAKAPLVYVNLVGGQDDIVFDGGSFAMDASGEVVLQLPEFQEVMSGEWLVVSKENTHSSPLIPQHSLWEAMKLGLSDYVRKNGFKGVLLGLSGGIDSALSATCAVDALGSDNVLGVLLPSPYTSKDSTQDALALAKNLGIQTHTIPITASMQLFEEVLSPVFKDAQWMDDVSVGGNLQARLRGITLMALSNKTGKMLLSTGNKSEIAVGYSTLYGDACGGYNVLGDLYKTQVYELARWRNNPSFCDSQSEDAESRSFVDADASRRMTISPIPQNSITRAPSAELAPGQLDQDQLPPYDVLDKILHHHIEERLHEAEIIAKGFDSATVGKILRLVRQNEYKRRQSCPAPKLSSMRFGKDRRYPLTNKF